jgi:8-hydroxy-5-deazaflavin:NADPH oxidoreductase
VSRIQQETVAIIGGTGALGFGLALRWARAGVPVVIGSREAPKAEGAARRILERLQGTTPEAGQPPIVVSVTGLENSQAATQAQIVVLAVPYPAQAGILKSIRGSLQDSVLVNATVPLAATVGSKPTRMLGIWQGSAAEEARELTPASIPVVAAFHNVSAGALEDLALTLDCDILVCGDDPAAKQKLFPLIERIPGLRPIDAGALEMARIVESLTALLISLNRQYKAKHSGVRITGIHPHAQIHGK